MLHNELDGPFFAAPHALGGDCGGFHEVTFGAFVACRELAVRTFDVWGVHGILATDRADHGC